MSNTTISWICNELSRLLEFSVTQEEYQDIAQYLISMESSRDVEDYLQSMLDLSNPEHRRFVEVLLNRLGYSIEKKSPTTIQTGSKKGQQVGKEDISDKQQSKKRVKQINLFSKEGQAKETITLPGQHKCECQASKHSLVRNCLECGRVICAQEGPGPCVFCTENMSACEKEALLQSNNAPAQRTKQSGRRFLDGTAPLPDKAFTTAMAHKEKLLEFDRTSEHRTRVIDDESDYFNADSNKWLNPKQRDALRTKEKELRDSRHGSRRQIKVTLDFAGRQVIEEQSTYEELFTEQQFEEERKEYYEEYAVNPALAFPRPIYDSAFDENASQVTRATSSKSDEKVRVQDAELQKMSDSGKCLSMHQPYASLLVAGIKKHEGRTWYSSHRGRLWIASTVKEPLPEEIKQLENFYKTLYGKTDLAFPQNYPSGCLLGCVEVVDILPQEEYRIQHPNGESESPYVFVCENPHELFVKFPNKGQHKIYKLDPAVHQTAKKSLRF
ncbi:hypothetical protein DAPPUDRAFT_315992 [Daphnia pulex]|uniref:Activating signal cointegrator 1 n=1 Tax=Daphnia pulex TaxID=6669 RepID=E9GBD9_DAPPU|nr:hypothetical protein DAPPUDRAFT_315992 [Daphnia pulex]|eukprot:EFX82942.1 hypothetical protein DAPPUDRAFT_315992 [Daphnia pulex]